MYNSIYFLKEGVLRILFDGHDLPRNNTELDGIYQNVSDSIN